MVLAWHYQAGDGGLAGFLPGEIGSMRGGVKAMQRQLTMDELENADLERIQAAWTDQPDREFSFIPIEDPALVSRTVLSSILMVVRQADILPGGPGRVTLRGEPFFHGGERPPCDAVLGGRKERSVSGSTAVLLTEDIVLTARHCVEDLFEQRFVFRDLTRELELEGIPGAKEDEVLIPEGLIGSGYGQGDYDRDWALVRVRRHAHPARAVVEQGGVRFGPLPELEEELWYGGFPGGLPLKVERGPVTRTAEAGVIRASMDVIGGASGSPVFDQYDRLVGVLRGFALPWAECEGGSCKVPRYSELCEQGITLLGSIFDGAGSSDELQTIRRVLETVSHAPATAPRREHSDDEAEKGRR